MRGSTLDQRDGDNNRRTMNKIIPSGTDSHQINSNTS